MASLNKVDLGWGIGWQNNKKTNREHDLIKSCNKNTTQHPHPMSCVDLWEVGSWKRDAFISNGYISSFSLMKWVFRSIVISGYFINSQTILYTYPWGFTLDANILSPIQYCVPRAVQSLAIVNNWFEFFVNNFQVCATGDDNETVTIDQCCLNSLLKVCQRERGREGGCFSEHNRVKCCDPRMIPRYVI